MAIDGAFYRQMREEKFHEIVRDYNRRVKQNDAETGHGRTQGAVLRD